MEGQPRPAGGAAFTQLGTSRHAATSQQLGSFWRDSDINGSVVETKSVANDPQRSSASSRVCVAKRLFGPIKYSFEPRRYRLLEPVNRPLEPAAILTRLTGMQGDVFFAVLSVVVAVCAASYLWIFLYRPAAFRFSLPQLSALVWYKRVPGKIYFGFALFGLGFMFFKALESALWWMPKAWIVWIDGEYRPVSWLIAVAIGFSAVNFVANKMEEAAQRISATRYET